MTGSAAQPAMADSGPHLLLYDGVCGLCDGLVQVVLKADPGGIFHFASLQSRAGHAALATFGAHAGDLTTMYVIVNYRTSAPRPLERGRAALFVMEALGWPWKAATVLRVLPRPALDRLYDLIARHRYQLFGRRDQCLLPSPIHRSRFLEDDRRNEP
jgi:predicted DCC family thiol-disulfide oxidoreductase YuxK